MRLTTALAMPTAQEERKFEIWNANVDEAADLNLGATGSVFYGANEYL